MVVATRKDYALDFSEVKLVISEVDGIITEHLAGIGEFNTVLFKQFCMKDFEAINMIKKDWGFVFITTDPVINISLCKKKNIPLFLVERNKRDVFVNILKRYVLKPDNILYIGNSYSDIECIKLAGISMCPEDAVNEVKNLVDLVLPIYSGTGVLCQVYSIMNNFKLYGSREE